MAGFTYGSANGGGGVHHYYEEPGLHHSFPNAYTNPNSVELLFQQHISSEQSLSPTMPQPAARQSISQQQAGSQPYGTTFIESRTGNNYPRRPMTMRRSVSSQYSPNSSGYQRSGSLQRPSRNSFGNDSRPHAIQMARAPSQYSSAPMHQAAHQPNATQPHLDTSNYYPSPLPPSSSPANPQYDPISATGTSDSIVDFGVSEIMGRHSVEAEQDPELFGRTTTTTDDLAFLAAFSQTPRPRLDSLVQLTSQDQLNTISSPRSDTPTNRRAPPSPVPHHSQTLSPPVRRRRRISPAQDGIHDPIVARVTLHGKFKCVDAACDDLAFGRQADFKRHYENTHSPNRAEYFCPVDGCSRSKNPHGGPTKGRSFNNRKDKMEEHVRTVHHLDESEGSSEVKVKGKRLRTKF